MCLNFSFIRLNIVDDYFGNGAYIFSLQMELSKSMILKLWCAQKSFGSLLKNPEAMHILTPMCRMDLHTSSEWNSSLAYYISPLTKSVTADSGRKVNLINLKSNQFSHKCYSKYKISHWKTISVLEQRHTVFCPRTSTYMHTRAHSPIRKATRSG